MSVKNYFDNHSHHHAYHNDPIYYKPIIDFIKKNESKKTRKILDFGCGDGMFLQQMIKGGIQGEFIGTDISISMINLAKQKLPKDNVQLIVSDGFKVPFKNDAEFDFIHLDMVLHHLIGKNREQSFRLAEKFLDIISDSLSKQGKIIVEEWNYLSYVIPSFSSFLIFYGLKFLNKTKIDAHKISDEIQLGLEVNFFEQKQLEKLLSKFGHVELIRKKPIHVTNGKKLFLLKEVSMVSYAVTI